MTVRKLAESISADESSIAALKEEEKALLKVTDSFLLFEQSEAHARKTLLLRRQSRSLKKKLRI